MIKLQNRACLADVANALGLTTAVEIGTHQGVFAAEFMKRFRGESIKLVDPYSGYEGEHTQFYPCFDEQTNNREADFAIASKAMLECAPGRHEFLKMTSVDASRQFENNSVGLVYIDGTHDYQSVIQDVTVWWPKVKRGGILSGHDYEHVSHPRVCEAVDRFFYFRADVQIIEEEMPSWWVIKP